MTHHTQILRQKTIAETNTETMRQMRQILRQILRQMIQMRQIRKSKETI